MRTLFLDAGHTAGKDPGACANGTTEHAEVSAIVDTIAATLPCVVVPKYLLLPAKIAWINRHAKDTDVLVSVHMNSGAPTASGLETYFYGGSVESRTRATALQKLLVVHLELPSRGVLADTTTRHGRLGIIRDTKPWAFLVELGFMTNAADIACVRAGAAGLAAVLQQWMDDTFR